jgi:hypothetical protein
MEKEKNAPPEKEEGEKESPLQIKAWHKGYF